MYVYKISYIVYALQYLKGRFSNNSKIFLLYDVACILKRHLEVRMYVYQSCITYIEVEILFTLPKAKYYVAKILGELANFRLGS